MFIKRIDNEHSYNNVFFFSAKNVKRSDDYSELLMHIDHFLVESGGELPLVVLRLPASQVDVSRADLAQRAWVKVNSLADRSLFIGDGCCFSLSAAVTGDGGDHIAGRYTQPWRRR